MTEDRQLQESRSRRSRHYRGRRRRESRIVKPENNGSESLEQSTQTKTKKRIKSPALYGFTLLLSLLLTVFSVANPFLNDLANNLQSQTLYAGMAMHQGQAPYLNFIGVDGVLYYIITYLGTFLSSSLGFAILQTLFLWVSGIYLSKIVYYLTKSSYLSRNYTAWFYALIFVFAWGGLAASIFVLPLLLASIWFLVRYFQDDLADEQFILFGIYLALGCFISPNTFLFWLIAVLVLWVYNFKHKRKARGFYQFLASLFGFLLVTYLLGYYILDSQIVAFLLPQSIGYGFLALTFDKATLLYSAGLLCLAFLASGLARTLFDSISRFKSTENRSLKIILILTIVFQFFFLLGNRYFELSQFVLLLPSGIVLMSLNHKKDSSVDESRLSYGKYHFYLPILACLLFFTWGVWSRVESLPLIMERNTIAETIIGQRSRISALYAWDNNASIYLKTRSLSASRIITAEPFLDVQENKTVLDYNIGQANAAYLVINNNIPLSDGMKEVLKESYREVQLETKNLTLYRKK